ncbi:hypothetical protein BFF78_27420 [Streptomyces fodineus]|uniref:Uncharacterized protein n=1 Tax=Streptomyces fodineus TaxID=1904616 RepID=A0A1D7YP43_9ACTN|nr:hypothetical protein BFF78_27420 [Streptomyces fodineus]
MSGLAVMIAGLALGAWVVFGAPHDWHGAKVLGRLALGGLGAVGMISGSAGLIFPDTPQGGPRTSQDGTGAQNDEA